ncbi:MAG: hypothetical protein ACRDQ0_22370 [Pseudonocardia sp.]
MTRESFEIAVQEEYDDAERAEPFAFHFSDDPDTDIVVYPPTEMQLVLFMSVAAMDRREMTPIQAGRAYNLLMSFMDQDSRSYVESRLQDRTLSMETLFAVFDKLIEQVGARPTEQSSDSSPQPSTTGKPSAGPARRAASTRSASPARRSATRSTGGSSTRSGSPAKAAKP